ncbi:GerAB/ArcD/ProY family transporter [Paenibacillus monticola]|uniref:GerAB/ArcD/ProY family transporter n=1 Tax=Paenibacillus monticola TaxID=2666075 RepID=A0A7X2H1N5_9BACL|nr:endospore germination permease [Paenibacillus monticola]MRN51905.1 GerAB/ArcD/ProY family transporter [Paenibacillus monticola]
MNNNRPITTFQFMAVIISTIIGVGILVFPRYMVEYGGNSAPLMSILAIFAALIGCWFTASVCRKYPNETLFVFSRRLLGRGMADFSTIIIFLFFLNSTSSNMRQFGEVCITVLFKRTPIEILMLILLILVGLSVRRNIVKFTYIHVFYLPFILISVIIILMLSLKKIDGLNLLPILGNNFTLSSFSKGVFLSASLYQGTFILILLVPLMRKPKQAVKAANAALFFSGIFYTIIVIVSLGMFGMNEIELLIYPTLELARSASFGTGLLERLDAIFIVVWVISVFTTIFTNYYLAVYALRELIRIKDQRLISSFLLPFIFVLSLLPQNFFQVYDVALVTSVIGLIFLTVYPFLLWVVDLIRNKGGLSHEK